MLGSSGLCSQSTRLSRHPRLSQGHPRPADWSIKVAPPPPPPRVAAWKLEGLGPALLCERNVLILKALKTPPVTFKPRSSSALCSNLSTGPRNTTPLFCHARRSCPPRMPLMPAPADLRAARALAQIHGARQKQVAWAQPVAARIFFRGTCDRSCQYVSMPVSKTAQLLFMPIGVLLVVSVAN